MILFPNAKINLGLQILRRREDGYHDIATVMVPIGWQDILEIVPGAGPASTFTSTGRPIDCPPADNLVMKALRALEARVGRQLPPVDIFLEKVIPDGAGLGGGSADAAFALIGFNAAMDLGLDKRSLAEVAATVGADCPFFIYNTPALCTGTGTTLSHIRVPQLLEKVLVVAKPHGAHVSTREAYAGAAPHPAAQSPAEILERPMGEWQSTLFNDFEKSVFVAAPEVKELKERLLALGAAYAAMSGSGAAVFGIFDNDKLAHDALAGLDKCDAAVCTVL